MKEVRSLAVLPQWPGRQQHQSRGRKPGVPRPPPPHLRRQSREAQRCPLSLQGACEDLWGPEVSVSPRGHQLLWLGIATVGKY